MNKLLTEYDQGYYPYITDLRWMDNAYRLAFTDTLKGISANTNFQDFIIYGCELTYHNTQTPYYSVNEGAIFHAGEIYHVYPHNFIDLVNQEPYVVFPANLFDPEGSALMGNGLTKDLYQIRKAIFIESTTPPTDENINYEDLVTLKYILNQHTHSIYALKEQELWHNVGEAGVLFEARWSNVSSSYDQMSFMKDNFGFIHLRGVVAASGYESGQYNLIATLPVGYRPSKKNHRLVYASNVRDEQSVNRIEEPHIVLIDPAGGVYFHHNPAKIDVPENIDLGHMILT